MSPRVVSTAGLQPLAYNPHEAELRLRARFVRRTFSGSPLGTVTSLASAVDDAIEFAKPVSVSHDRARLAVVWAWSRELGTSWFRRLVAGVVHLGFRFLTRGAR